MICKNKVELESAISTMVSSDEDLFDKVKPYIQNANRWIKNAFIGDALYREYESMDKDTKDAILQLVAVKAFHEAIPYLDLVLDINGFGIVSTQHVAPASKERVERLLNQALSSANNLMDELIIRFIESDLYRPMFQESRSFYLLTDSLYVTAVDLELYAGVKNATRIDLSNKRVNISIAENELKKRISVEYFQDLITKYRNNDLSDLDREALSQSKRVMGLYIRGESEAAYSMGDQLVNFIESNIDEFTAYRESVYYKNKGKGVYENKKESGIFVFGGH